ncbi:hypothetical protein PR048_019035 [Dryococelus australis]|uniref:Uncharacterized protein n=1 Tax=Dryococelus australis TaxID=614101 RepID=A0ABQ9H2G8_9NEOP|nr:hypothetical protein PR048_019035 [Dryococelus australis]
MVTDNGANIKLCCKLSPQEISCSMCAHTLNLCIRDAVEQSLTLLDVCKGIVGHFKSNNVAWCKLIELQRQMGLPELKVKQDVATWWNFTLNMMERLPEIRVPISAAISNLPKAMDYLHAQPN